MVGILVLTSALITLIFFWWREKVEHNKRLENLKVRIYVNGIRGKSTVTRMVAGILREAGFRTIAKTTGSAARVILDDGFEIPIQRISAPTIMELLNTLKQHTKKETEAIVFETMALHPQNQIASQDLLVKGNINIITNIREDHQDVMGETLEEITDTLSLTIPQNGVLITSEDRKELRDRLAKNAKVKNSQLIYADPSSVTEKDLSGFSYISFKENVAIGLTIANILGIPRATAIRGMWNTRPDIGVVTIQRTLWNDKEIVWAPLFAVNDRESTIISMDALKPYYNKNATRIGILNNRLDRADRAMRFADIAAKDLDLDYYITFGAYEEQVSKKMIEQGVKPTQIINLGFSVNPSLEDIFNQVSDLIQTDQGLLIGLVNIHTEQAELLLEYFAEQPDAPIHLDDEEAWEIFRTRSERIKEKMIPHLWKKKSDV